MAEFIYIAKNMDGMKNHPWVIILIIIIGAGLLTGITNFLLMHEVKFSRKETLTRLARQIFLSLCAAFTVPLFLNILQSDILEKLDFKKYFIFAGFCVLASYFARRFLDNVYSKVENLGKKVEETKKETDDRIEAVTKKAEDVSKKVEDLEESGEENENLPSSIKEAIVNQPQLSLTQDKIGKIIEALFSRKYSFRTIQGIAKESEETEDKIIEVMTLLQDRGLAESRTGQNGKDYWRILKHPIKIYSASYGIPGKIVDVTDRIKELVGQNIFSGSVSPDFLRTYDPAYGDVKILKIHCRINGKEKELIFTDGQTFTIGY